MNRKQFLIHTVQGVIAAALAPYLPKVLHAEMAPEAAKRAPGLSRGELITAAREIMASQQYCALITQDQEGRSQARTVNPFAPDEKMIVWIATSTQTRKVQQIRRNPQVALYYADHAKASGYVSIQGKALLVDDRAEMIKRKREYWNSVFPAFKNLVLIQVIPEQLEVINYSRGVNSDPSTWRAPSIDFPK